MSPLAAVNLSEVKAAPALSVQEVYQLHGADVARWVARLAGPSVDLEDLVQEVFLLVQRHLPSYRGECRLTTWLFRITENLVRQHRRRERWRRFLGRSQDVGERTRRAPEGTPEENLSRQQAQELVYRAMEGMSERYRTVIVLFELEDLPGEEVADLLGIKVSNLWVVLHRARADLVRRVTALREVAP